MQQGVKRVYQFLILLGVGVLLFVLALSTPVLYNSEDFSIYNPGWNGCSSIAVKTYESGRLQPTYYVKTKELTLGQNSFAEYDMDSNTSSIFIIGPQTSFTSGEAGYVKSFLNNGGLLFIADDFGTGNDLLSRINASCRFSNDLMLDLSFEKKASFVTVFDFANRSHPLVFNVSSILLNYPTFIVAGGDSEVLANSSEMSWVDTNLNGKHDDAEVDGPFPVLVVENYGRGRIVLLSDPSVLINSMKDKLDNSQFRGNLLGYMFDGRSTVIIDESHRDLSAPYHLSYFMAESIGMEFKISIILLVVFLFMIGFTGLPKIIWFRFRKMFFVKKQKTGAVSYDEMIEDLIREHPSWSKKKLEEIIKGVEYD